MFECPKCFMVVLWATIKHFLQSTLFACTSTGVATSSNGVDWERLPSAPSASPSATAAQDQSKRDKKLVPQGKGCVMEPGQDWWTFDTCHMAVSDVQVCVCVCAHALSLAIIGVCIQIVCQH